MLLLSAILGSLWSGCGDSDRVSTPQSRPQADPSAAEAAAPRRQQIVEKRALSNARDEIEADAREEHGDEKDSGSGAAGPLTDADSAADLAANAKGAGGDSAAGPSAADLAK